MGSPSQSFSGTNLTVSTLPLDGILSSSKEQSHLDTLYPGFVHDLGIGFEEMRPRVVARGEMMFDSMLVAVGDARLRTRELVSEGPQKV